MRNARTDSDLKKKSSAQNLAKRSFYALETSMKILTRDVQSLPKYFLPRQHLDNRRCLKKKKIRKEIECSEPRETQLLRSRNEHKISTQAFLSFTNLYGIDNIFATTVIYKKLSNKMECREPRETQLLCFKNEHKNSHSNYHQIVINLLNIVGNYYYISFYLDNFFGHYFIFFNSFCNNYLNLGVKFNTVKFNTKKKNNC